jgi:copper(I)-binding protein
MKQVAKKFITLLILSVLSSASLAQLVVNEGFVRKPIPGRSMSAAFMTITNTSSQDIVLTKASLEGARSVEIHTHSHKDGVMRMRQLHELSIAAGESVSLAPGGLHLMVFGISQLPPAPKLELCDQEGHSYSSNLELRSLVK